MAAVGTQVVFYALLVADVNEEMLEDAYAGILTHRDGYATLEHVLQQSYGFQTDTLSTGIRTTDDEDALFAMQLQVERNNLLSLFGEVYFQQRVTSLHPVYNRRIGNLRCDALYAVGQMCLGTDEFYVCQEGEAAKQFLHIGTEHGGKISKNADDFAPFVGLELTNAVIGFHHIGRFYVDRLSGGTFIVYNSTQATFHGRCHRNDKTSVTDGGRYVLVHQALCLGGTQYAVQCVADAAFCAL